MNESDKKDKAYQWRCTTCGHIYDGNDIPRDYICPVCGAKAPSFEREEKA